MMSLESVLWVLTQYQYLVLFPLVIVEGPIVTVLAGLLVSFGQMHFWWALLVIVAGDLSGDYIYYLFGYWGKEGFVTKWGKWVGMTAERVKKMDRHFEEHLGKTLILGKLAHGIGAAALFCAGASRVSVLKFLWYNFVATVPKSFLLLCLGLYSGQAYERISRYLDYSALIAFLVVLVGVLGGYAFVKRKLGKIIETNE